MNTFIYDPKTKWTGEGESVESQIAMCRNHIQYSIEGENQADIMAFEEELPCLLQVRQAGEGHCGSGKFSGDIE